MAPSKSAALGGPGRDPSGTARVRPRSAAGGAGNSAQGIEADELPPLAGKRVLHLQCHFGADSLKLRTSAAPPKSSASISPPRRSPPPADLAREIGPRRSGAVRGSRCLDAPVAVPEPHGFDLVYRNLGSDLLASGHPGLGQNRRGDAAPRRRAVPRRGPSRRLRAGRRHAHRGRHARIFRSLFLGATR